MLYGDQDFNDKLKLLIKFSDKDEYKYPHYKTCADYAEEMEWHAYGEKPVTLLQRVRPREDSDITKYRLENYEPTTTSAFDKALDVVSKIFNPNLFSIRWKNKNAKTEEFKQYTFEYYPEFNSVVSFMKDTYLRSMIADPNAIAVVKPRKIPEKTTDRVDPVVVIFGCENIWNFDNDHYLIFLYKELVPNEARQSITWFYFEYYDKDEYVKFKAYISPNQDQLIVEEIESYQYNFTEIPVWRLRGKAESMSDGNIIYKSFFDAAISFWNLSIIHTSDLHGAYVNHLFPQKYELAEHCEYKFNFEGMNYPCRNGKIKYDKGEIDCPSCGGSGWRNMAGAYGVYKYSKEKLSEDGNIGIDPVGYITVPVDAAKMLEERADKMEKKGLWAINMDVEDEVGQNQSGIAKVIDRSAQYDTLYNISQVVFDVSLQNIFYFFSQYMFGVSDRTIVNDLLPEINKPTQFEIYSASDLINNFKIAKESGLDPNFISIKTQEIISRDLSTNPDLKAYQLLLIGLDPLSGWDADVIGINVMKGFTSKEDAIIHFNIKKFVDRAIKEKKNFYTLQIDEQYAILQGYAQEFEKANKPQIDLTQLENRQKNQKTQV